MEHRRFRAALRQEEVSVPLQPEQVSIFILNSDFIPFYVVQDFVSLIWTERYWKVGEFELGLIFKKEYLDSIKVGNYVAFGKSENLMVVEQIQIGYDPGDKRNQTIQIKGRTLASIFDRRIMWGTWGSETVRPFESIIFDCLRQTVISPSDVRRTISMFSLKSNSELNGISLAAMGDGDGVLEIIETLCETYQVGFKTRYDENKTKKVEFSLYLGKDRSYNQMDLPPVIFSSGYENLGPSRFGFDTTEYKTVCLVASGWSTIDETDDEGNVISSSTTRTTMEVGDASATGLNRREAFVKGSEDNPDVLLTNGKEALAKANQLEELDAELDAKRQFVYGEDFFMGDIVQVVTDFGLDKRARVIEFIRSWDSNGYTEVPVFKMMED